MPPPRLLLRPREEGENHPGSTGDVDRERDREYLGDPIDVRGYISVNCNQEIGQKTMNMTL